MRHVCCNAFQPPSKMTTEELIETHKSRFLVKLLDLKRNDQLFDFTIFVEGRKFQAHRLVLAASSDYFEGMFAHKCRERDQGTATLKDVDPDAIESILDFCYTHKLDLNKENTQDILLAASMLQVQAIQDLCVHYLLDRIDASNCLSVFNISERCNLTELSKRANDYCLRHFESVIDEREFLEIDGLSLARIVSNDELNVEDEAIVLQAVIKWYKEDIENRRDHLYMLLRAVRFVFMDPAFLVDLTTKDPIQSSQETKDLINKAKDYLLLRNQPTLQKQYASQLILKPRERMDEEVHIYAVGGWHDKLKAIAAAEVYDPKTKSWTVISPMHVKRCGVGVTSLNNSIYAVGGHNGLTYLDTVERYDIQQGLWLRDVANMNYARTSVGVVTLDGRIYAIGGETTRNSGATNTVEVYDPTTNSWSYCSPMIQRRFGAGVVVLDGSIYVLGGSEGAALFDTSDTKPTNSIYNSVERYDPQRNTWVNVSPMKVSRKHLGSCTCRGMIYAVGGRNELGQLDSAEVYDPSLDAWEEISPMQIKRSGIGLVQVSHKVYAIGGQGGKEDLNEVEAYDPETDIWSWMTPMHQRRLGGGITIHTTKKPKL